MGPKTRHNLIRLALLVAAGTAWIFSTTRSPLVQTLRAQRFIMGVPVQIVAVSPDPKKAKKAMESAFREIERIDALMSNWKETSELSRINRQAAVAPVEADPELVRLLRRALGFSRVTRGAFNPLMGPLIRLWGFRGGPRRVPDAAAVAQALARSDLAGLELGEVGNEIAFRWKGMEIDLGGIAKGYAIDMAATALREGGVRGGIVNAGGDLFAFGSKEDGGAWKVGLQTPGNREAIYGKLRISGRAVATSGGSANFFEAEGVRYSHILDPRTGRPVDGGITSATVEAPTATEADALATALCVMSPSVGMSMIERLPGVEAILTLPADSKENGLKWLVSSGIRGRVDLKKAPPSREAPRQAKGRVPPFAVEETGTFPRPTQSL